MQTLIHNFKLRNVIEGYELTFSTKPLLLQLQEEIKRTPCQCDAQLLIYKHDLR